MINPGFEEADGSSPASWIKNSYLLGLGGTDCQFVHDATVKRSGNKSAKITCPTTRKDDARWKQTVSLEVGARYRLTGWMKTDSVVADGSRGASITPDDGSNGFGVLFSAPQVTGTSDWAYKTFDFTAPTPSPTSAIHARLGYFGSVASGSVWYDDLTLHKLGTGGTPPPPPSTRFHTGDKVKIIRAPNGVPTVYVRGPDACGPVLEEKSALTNEELTITSDTSVRCGGGVYNWVRWPVRFPDGLEGWIVEWRLRPVVAGPPPPPPRFELGTAIRIKALPVSTAGAYYRNDPATDGSCGAVDGEEQVGARGVIIGARNVCTTDGRIRWKVRFTSGAEGWVTQNRLEVVSPTSRAPSASDPAIANTLDGLRRSIESLQNLINQH